MAIRLYRERKEGSGAMGVQTNPHSPYGLQQLAGRKRISRSGDWAVGKGGRSGLIDLPGLKGHREPTLFESTLTAVTRIQNLRMEGFQSDGQNESCYSPHQSNTTR